MEKEKTKSLSEFWRETKEEFNKIKKEKEIS